MLQVVLKPRKAAPFYGRHPWVLDSAIERVEGEPTDGDVVDLVSDKGKWVARGVFNSKSRIRVRLYSWDAAEQLNDAFWHARLQRAISLRDALGYVREQGAARLVFSEADGLSGLVVDRYADWLVVQVTALAMLARLERLVPMLVELVRPLGVLVRGDKGVARLEGIELPAGVAWGETHAGPVFIEEHGIRYGVDLAEGQKTGFYLDQRENRRAAATYVAGRRVLDMFCYSGAFSLSALLLGKAREVLGIDASEKAIALARANAQLNSVSGARFEAANCFEALAALRESGERFGAVILDPPKFAQSRRAADEALRAYHRLNRLAIELLDPSGVLVTCSCSGHVTREDFLYMLVGVAQKSGRDVQILEQRGASPDHPTSATCLETDYLKCFICRVV